MDEKTLFNFIVERIKIKSFGFHNIFGDKSIMINIKD